MILSRFVAAICKILIRLKHFRVSGPAAFFSYPLFLFLPNHLQVSLHCAEWALLLLPAPGCCTCYQHKSLWTQQPWGEQAGAKMWWECFAGQFIFLDNNDLLGPLLGGGRCLLLFLTLLIPNDNFCCFGSKRRPLFWGFPDLGRTRCACRSAGCCFRMEKQERKSTYLLLGVQSNM